MRAKQRHYPSISSRRKMSSSRKQLKRKFRSSTSMQTQRLLMAKLRRQRSPPQGVLVFITILMVSEQLKTNSDSASQMSTSTSLVCQPLTHLLPLDVKSAENLSLLQRSGITHVVNLIAHRSANEKPIICTDAHIKQQQHANNPPAMPSDSAIKYLKLSMRDQVDSDITFYLYSVIEFIEEALRASSNNAKILVHCFKV